MLKLIKKFPELILFGVLTACFSSPGQTFLVSLFIPSMRDEFGLSQTGIAGVYSAATLVSAFSLPWLGRMLDRIHLTRFTVLAGMLLAAGCLLLSQARGIAILFIGFFLIRNLGQGTLTMVSSTTMAKVFGAARGKALGFSNLGYPLGEAVFPVMVSAWILAYGWRSGWIFLAGWVILIFIPLTFFLLRRDPHDSARREIEEEFSRQSEEKNLVHSADLTVSAMLKDPRFYLLLFPLLIPPVYFTALFFHQVSLAEWKNWSLQIISASFIAFGICRAAVSFLVGPAIDRLSASRIFPFNLIPLGCGLAAYLYGTDPVWSFVYLGLAGMTMGLSMTISSALFAEFYGTKELGAIRGVTSSTIILSTAAAPVLLGTLLDADINPRSILHVMIVLIVIGTVLGSVACRKRRESKI